jgi:hypothetical protein
MADRLAAFKGIGFEAFMLLGVNFEDGTRIPDVVEIHLECFTNRASHFNFMFHHLNCILRVLLSLQDLIQVSNNFSFACLYY